MRTILIINAILLLLATPMLQAADNMKAFLPAEEGMVRYVLHLTEKDDEALFRVELIVGKTVLIDQNNQYFFGGHIEMEQIAGWGFTQYKVRNLGPMGGTRMAVDPNAKKIDRFITIGGGPYLIRYNSRLPIVVYVSEGVEVLYRIWSAGADIKKIEKG
jgi:ecotin